jgi:hypothetical protein
MDFGLSEDDIRLHDSLNEKIRKDAFRNKLRSLIRDSFFNMEIDRNEFKFWCGVIEDDEPQKKRKVAHGLVVPK